MKIVLLFSLFLDDQVVVPKFDMKFLIHEDLVKLMQLVCQSREWDPICGNQRTTCHASAHLSKMHLCYGWLFTFLQHFIRSSALLLLLPDIIGLWLPLALAQILRCLDASTCRWLVTHHYLQLRYPLPLLSLWCTSSSPSIQVYPQPPQPPLTPQPWTMVRYCAPRADHRDHVDHYLCPASSSLWFISLYLFHALHF